MRGEGGGGGDEVDEGGVDVSVVEEEREGGEGSELEVKGEDGELLRHRGKVGAICVEAALADGDDRGVGLAVA